MHALLSPPPPQKHNDKMPPFFQSLIEVFNFSVWVEAHRKQEGGTETSDNDKKAVVE
jgi:hypothetical protein